MSVLLEFSKKKILLIEQDFIKYLFPKNLSREKGVILYLGLSYIWINTAVFFSKSVDNFKPMFTHMMLDESLEK